MSYSRVVDQGYLSFARGLATEISPLSLPEEYAGTTSDELNMAVDTEGMVRVRRRGFDLTGLTGPLPGTVHDSKFWRSAGFYVSVSSSAGTSGMTLIHVSLVDTSGSTHNTRLYTVQVSNFDFAKPTISFIRSKCLISTGARPLLLTKEPSGNFTFQYVNLYIRDFRLYPDGLSVTEGQALLTDEHKYNLLNAGWHQDRNLLSSNTVGDPIENFKTIRTKYPSNADVPYLGDITDTNGDLKFDPKSYDNVSIGSSEAPRGHYIYSTRDVDRQARVADKSKDGAPITTLTTIMLGGNDPVTGVPVPTGVTPIDTVYPDTTPGVIVP